MPRSTETQRLSLGIFAHSRKENERRLPVHPAHFDRIEHQFREQIFLESGYGAHFGATDGALAGQVGGIHSREQLIAECDVILLPKVQAEDLAEMNVGQVILGWPHCVQDAALTQIAIDRKLTLIAFEAMNHWNDDGSFALHVFHKNNELAGYCSVLHALELLGVTGNYGRRLRATVIGFGATGRGAVTALNALGVDDVRVLTNRDVAAVASPIHSTQIIQMRQDAEEPTKTWADTPDGSVRMADFLAGNDIIVNCVLQDPGSPLIFITTEELDSFTPGSLIVDVSCDTGMGFTWARPTSFLHPMIEVEPKNSGGRGIHYYAVDHSPSYLWNSATWEISEGLLPHIATLLNGPAAWDASPTISRAIEIRDGVVLNPGILSFQNREDAYPHAVRD